MWQLIGIITALALVLGTGVRAEAQTGERVFDALTDILRGTQHLQGNVVAVRDGDMILRGRDNRTYIISTTEVDRQRLAGLQPGQALKVNLKRGSGQALIAASIQPDAGENRSFRTVSGVVESVSGDRVQFRTSEGFVIPVDLAQIVGSKPSLRQGDQATLIYEQSGQNALAGVWIEPRASFGAASPRTTEPAGVTPGGYERIHGLVESVGIGTLTLQADDGRKMMIDIRNSRGSAADVRPGDLINVVGRASGDTFVAEVIQK